MSCTIFSLHVKQYRKVCEVLFEEQGALTPGLKQTGHEADYSSPSRAEVKNVWSYTSAPPVHLHDVVLN